MGYSSSMGLPLSGGPTTLLNRTDIFFSLLKTLSMNTCRCPNLKILFFPNLEEDEGMQVPKLFCKWMKLERLCMSTPRSSFKSILTEINRHYDNFIGLELIYRITMFPFDVANIVNTMSLPFLKRL